MQAAFFSDITLIAWETWIVPAAGVLTSGLMLLAGRTVLRWRRAPEPRPLVPPEPSSSSAGPDPFDYGSPTNRRRALRRNGKSVEVLINQPGETPAPAAAGWVVDRSSGGLRLFLAQAVPESTVLKVSVGGTSPATSPVDLEVTNCVKEGDGFLVGCQFVGKPTWPDILQFG